MGLTVTLTLTLTLTLTVTLTLATTLTMTLALTLTCVVQPGDEIPISEPPPDSAPIRWRPRSQRST